MTKTKQRQLARKALRQAETVILSALNRNAEMSLRSYETRVLMHTELKLSQLEMDLTGKGWK